MQTMTFPKVLQEARRLPPEVQIELAEELLREVGLPRVKRAKSPRTLNALSALGTEELRSLADAAVAPSRQRRLRALLRKNREQELSRTEQIALNDLIVETDRIALLKARALYTLAQRGKKATNSK